MESRMQRPKRSSFILNLVQTSHGYSIVEGTELLNKAEIIVIPQQIPAAAFVPPAKATNYNYSNHSKDIAKTQFKKTFLYFPKQQEVSTSNISSQPPLVSINILHNHCLPKWFSIKKVHQVQRNNFKEWAKYCSCIASMQIQQLEALYKMHRNKMLSLAENNKYLSLSTIREHICFDAFWLMKIYNFLQNYGIINLNHKQGLLMKNTNLMTNQDYIFKNASGNNHSKLEKKKECNGTSQNNQQNTYDLFESQYQLCLDEPLTNQYSLLFRSTEELRPFCDFCGIHCGMAWFQHSKYIDEKEVAYIMNKVNFKNHSLSSKLFQFILCPKCYCNGKFPLLLTHQDFKKMTVNDKIEAEKHVRRSTKKRNDKGKENQDQEEQDRDSGRENGVLSQERKSQENQSLNKEEIFSPIVSKIGNNIHKVKKMSLQQIQELLSLIKKHGEDWITIMKKMENKKMCVGFTTEDLIKYFVLLPKMGITKLKYEDDNNSLIQNNPSQQEPNKLNTLYQQKMNEACKIAEQWPQSNNISLPTEFPSKHLFDQVVRLKINQWLNRYKELQSMQAFYHQFTQLSK